MKKFASILCIVILLISVFSIHVYADTLDTINVSIDKETIHPGQNIMLNVGFGQDLGAYTVEIEYDSSLVKFESAEGGTSNDTGEKVIVTFYDTQGGASPRNNMHAIFTANTEGITSSNPTQFKVTMKGMTSPDTHTTYDDITQPYTKSFVVEPEYEDYKINLSYTGAIRPAEEKDMKITVSSAMGKNYEHTRINAVATAPEGANVKLLRIDGESLEHDIIQSGWGSDEGDPIGGEDVEKELAVRGLFSKVGDYSITLSLVDRDEGDEVISSKTFKISVTDKAEEKPNNKDDETDDKAEDGQDKGKEEEKEKEPETLPKTGNMIYLTVVPIVLGLIAIYAVLDKKES